MSLETTVQADAPCQSAQCSSIRFIITPKDKDLGGFSVRRVLPSMQQRMVGPWLFFDHMGPAEFKAGDGINVRPHPHIHLATVTYLFEGEILHRDSLGSYQPIRPGDVNLMVAGKGIVHSERERPEVTAIDHQLHGLQLWLALPEEQQNRDPAFYHYPDHEIPQTTVDDVPVRVIMGDAYDLSSPVMTFADTLYVEAALQPGQVLTLPDAQERAVYMASGSAMIDATEIQEHQMAIINPDASTAITAKTACRLAIIGGEQMSPRRMFWNFASTDTESIEQAKRDWEEDKFPVIPDDNDERIPLPR
ncbi:pirin family protein [Alteromonas sp. ASW11-36]|uniref:Pirin family protein n=1 Tax=Alteromonas arenosi TaxID=3055817 RepID=A0ABT7SVQ4_9ALTE|nr:pirin family protein [Alteromonas sp. ASW11-36]MDM7860274.1 pirin family protein [Alteromonas sp. ASW11-36]